MLERVLVAIDDSAPSRHALDIAVEFCVESNAKAHVVHIRELALSGAYRADWHDEPHDVAARLVDNAVSVLRSSSCEVVGSVCSALHADVARGILEEAASCEVGVIIVGSRGRGSVASLILGSTTNKLLHLSERPVRVVPS